MKKIIYFNTVEERNNFITECYNKEIIYNYRDCDKEGKYKVTYWKE